MSNERFFLLSLQALKHSMAAIKYSTEKKDLAEAYHLQGTLFKDLNQLSEAVEVQLCNRFHALYNYSNYVTQKTGNCCSCVDESQLLNCIAHALAFPTLKDSRQ